jgi:LysR family cyn operon transcriptional activator
MEIRQLRYFLAVAEHGHVTRAARAAFVSQPALSQQLQALEREVGMPLFDRLPRGVELTAAGRVLRDHARAVVRQADDARAAMDDLRGTLRGEVTVAAVQTASVVLVVDAIAAFHALHPGVVVRAREARADDVLRMVQQGDAGIGVTYLAAAEPVGFACEALYEEELVLVVRPDHPLAGRTVPAARAGELPLVVPPGGYCLRRGIDEVLAEAGARQRVVAEIASLEGICAAVRAGVGAAVLPARYAVPRLEAQGLAMVRLAEPVPRRTVGVVRAAERHACTATRAFLDALRLAAAGSEETRAA